MSSVNQRAMQKSCGSYPVGRFWGYLWLAFTVFTPQIKASNDQPNSKSPACQNVMGEAGEIKGETLPESSYIPDLNTDIAGLRKHTLPNYLTILQRAIESGAEASIVYTAGSMIRLASMLEPTNALYNGPLHKTLANGSQREIAVLAKHKPLLEEVLREVEEGGRPLNTKKLSRLREQMSVIAKTFTEESKVAVVPQSNKPSDEVSPQSVSPASPQEIAVKILDAAVDDNKAPATNVIFSQSSLDSLFSLVGLGYNSSTRKLLEGYLGNSVETVLKQQASYTLNSPGVTLLSANNIWKVPEFAVKDGFLTALNRVIRGLKPGTFNADDADGTAKMINEWIGDRTDNMLGEVVAPGMITPNLVMLLVNALYFKGTWLTEFDIENTYDDTFTKVDRSGKAIEGRVPMMNQYGTEIQYRVEELGGKKIVHVRLPYVGNEHAMYISFAISSAQLERFEPVVLQPLVETDVVEVYKQAIRSGSAFKKYGEGQGVERFSMPKFKIVTSMNILPTFLGNGYMSLGAPGQLTELTDDARAKLSFVLQKASIEVDEKGSVAAAATVGGIALESVRAPDPSILINGPFAYAIRDDKKGITLFEGVVRDPSAQ